MLRLCCDYCWKPVGFHYIYDEYYGVFCSDDCNDYYIWDFEEYWS